MRLLRRISLAGRRGLATQSQPLHAHGGPSIPSQALASSQQATAMASTTAAVRPSRLSRIVPYLTGQLAKEEEIHDLLVLEHVACLASTLRECKISNEHPLHELAAAVREELEKAASTASSTSTASGEEALLLYLLKAANKPLLASIAATNVHVEAYASDFSVHKLLDDGPREWQWQAQVNLRAMLLQEYLARLSQAVKAKEEVGVFSFSSSSSSSTSSPLSTLQRLCDCFLLGTGSERVQEHFALYEPTFTQAQLQDSFYLLLEPEVSAMHKTTARIKALHPQLRKKLKGFCSLYLLDKLELNVKSRCVFFWCDPEYTGFNPLDATHTIPVVDIVKARRLYFLDAHQTAHAMLSEMIRERRTFYYDKKEWNETASQGLLFFFGVVAVGDVFLASR